MAALTAATEAAILVKKLAIAEYETQLDIAKAELRALIIQLRKEKLRALAPPPALKVNEELKKQAMLVESVVVATPAIKRRRDATPVGAPQADLKSKINNNTLKSYTRLVG